MEAVESTGRYNADGIPWDTQESLDYYYGTDYYNYARDFKYSEEYEEMVTQVNEYRGFYIGRYETTIDGEGNIGSKNNTEIATSKSILKEGTNPNDNNKPYYYRWYGLYYKQKNSNVAGNGTTIQTGMIYGQLWDKTMEYIEAQKIAVYTTYTVNTETLSWHTGNNIANAGDVALNIYDLEGNAWEWKQEAIVDGNNKAWRIFTNR